MEQNAAVRLPHSVRFYKLIEAEYKAFNPKEKSLYTAENLQNICLGLHSLCKGAESKFFDGHTNITDNNFVTFGVKGLLQASKNIRNALLFNVLAYMSEQLLSRGNTVASIDEFYLFLTNLTAVEYIRNFMKRVRKKSPLLYWQVRILRTFSWKMFAN